MGDARDAKRGTRVYVGGLPPSVEKAELEREFGKFGKLNSVWVAYNPPGFAFIEFLSRTDAEAACKELNNCMLLGSKVRVEISRGRGRSGTRDPFKGSRGGPRGAPRGRIGGGADRGITARSSRGGPREGRGGGSRDTRRSFGRDGPRGGFDRNGPRGFDRDGPRRGGFDRDGPPRGGFDRNDQARAGFERDAPRSGGFDRDGPPRGGFDRDGPPRSGFDRDGPRGAGFDRDGPPRSGFDRDGPRGGGFDRDVPPRGSGFDRDIQRGGGGFDRDVSRGAVFDRDASRGGFVDTNVPPRGAGFDRDGASYRSNQVPPRGTYNDFERRPAGGYAEGAVGGFGLDRAASGYGTRDVARDGYGGPNDFYGSGGVGGGRESGAATRFRSRSPIGRSTRYTSFNTNVP